MNSSVGSGFTFCPFSRGEIASHVSGNSACLVSGTAAPSNLTALAVSSSQINLAWQDNSSNESGFVVESKTGADGTWSQAGTTAPNLTSYNRSGMVGNVTYYFRVQANGSAGPSSYSNEAFATTLGNPPTISGLQPASGAVGTQVTVMGSGFAGATAVRFNSTNAGVYSVQSSTQILATVPAGATTGSVSVTTPSGTAASSTQFTVNSSSSRCDLNGDGMLNVLDLQLLINSVLGIPGSPAGDLNRDGSTNVLDLQLLINVVLGLRACPA
jgi:hypothetical protein